MMPDPGEPNGAGTSLTRMTFNLTPRAVAALDSLVASHRGNRTDEINRALVLAALIDTLTDPDGLRIVGPDGTTERIHLL